MHLFPLHHGMLSQQRLQMLPAIQPTNPSDISGANNIINTLASSVTEDGAFHVCWFQFLAVQEDLAGWA
jgi:hypothetical protein